MAGFGGQPLVSALSELAARVQRGRTEDAVLRIAGEGLTALGMRLLAFQIVGDEILLRHLATSAPRLAALEDRIGGPIVGCRAPLAACAPAAEIVAARRNVYREDLDIFDRFCRASTGFDPTTLDASPPTAGISNGVLAPVYVDERPWGLLSVVSRDFSDTDADAVALFATQVGSALEVARYIEELSATNARLQRAQQDLVERERLAALGEVAAVIAHEIRNPLAVIFNAVTSLRRSIDRATSKDSRILVAIVEEESRRLEGIVSDLLELARPTELQRVQVRLRPLVDAVVTNAASADTTKGVRFLVDVPADLPSIDLDPRLVRQALVNLVLNAIQASADDGLVEIRARAGDGSLFIDVVDEGEGIPLESRPRIFEPFFTTKPTGTGLGLALVKRVVESHGGSLALTSSSSGTTFGIVLPLAATAPLAQWPN